MSTDGPDFERNAAPSAKPAGAVFEVVEVGPASALSPSSMPATPPVRRSIAAWRMGLVVSASALCGGIAVVLWNRRLLMRMREEAGEAAPGSPQAWEDDA